MYNRSVFPVTVFAFYKTIALDDITNSEDSDELSVAKLLGAQREEYGCADIRQNQS
jgi:hypothetical protein